MNQAKHIFIVDDDEEILQLLSKVLEQHGYKISTAINAELLLQAFDSNNPISKTIDMILLDVMLPDGDGISLCQTIRKKSTIPIILLTANTSESDRIIGLEFGADDYIQKPFNPRELVARIKAIFRRTSVLECKNRDGNKSLVYQFRGWKVNASTHQLYSPNEVEVPITSACYELLIAFLEHPKRVLSRDFLLDITKNRTADIFDRSIDILVSRLRQKFEIDTKNPTLIKTIRNSGYMFTESVELI